jgi:heat shock protein HslJ
LSGFFVLLTGCSAAESTAWKLAQITSEGMDLPIPVGVSATIILDENGTVSGYSGVNTFIGSYERDAGKVRWTSPFRSTRRGGQKEHMAFEHAFLSVLQACDTVTQDKALTFTSTKGRLIFEVAAK